MGRILPCLQDEDFTTRNLIKNAIPDSIVTEREKELIDQYNSIAETLHATKIEEGKIISRNNSGKYNFLDSCKLKMLRKKINMYSEQLLSIERSQELDQVLEREERRILKIRGEEVRQREKERQERKDKESLENYKRNRRKAVQGYYRQRILKALGLHDEKLTYVEDLAVLTVISIFMARDENKQSFVCSSNITYCDSLVFATFLLRMICLTEVSQQSIAEQFTNEYVMLVCAAVKKFFSDQTQNFTKLFDNRVMLYEQILIKNYKKQDIILSLMEEFEYVLKADVFYGKYISINQADAIPVLGIEQDVRCHEDVRNLIEILLYIADDQIKKVKDMLKN